MPSTTMPGQGPGRGSSESTALAPAPLAAARSLRDAIEASADSAEEQCRLDPAVVEQVSQRGLFGLMVPEVLGGFEADPRTVLDVIAELSYADGSYGWALMANMVAGGIMGSYLPDDAVQQIFGSPDGYVTAGHAAPLGTAERVEGGFRVRGRFQFASGVHNAQWLEGGFLETSNGEIVLRDGKPNHMMAIVPISGGRLLGNWNVMGLRATGSEDFEIFEQVIPESFTLGRLVNTVYRGGPVYKLGVSLLTGLGHAGFAVGASRRLLDEMVRLAGKKKRAGSLLAETPTFQKEYGTAEAELRSATLYVYDSFQRAFEAAQTGEVPLELRADCRLATCHVTFAGYRLSEWAYQRAGSDGLRNGSRLQRVFRDLHASSQHLFVDEQIILDSARVLLGLARREDVPVL